RGSGIGKYDRWNAFFAGMESDEVVLTLEELEEALGSPLPPSARRYPTWWSSAQHHARWAYSSSPRSAPRAAPRTVLSGERLILLECVAQKRARDLLLPGYGQVLWSARR